MISKYYRAEVQPSGSIIEVNGPGQYYWEVKNLQQYIHFTVVTGTVISITIRAGSSGQGDISQASDNMLTTCIDDVWEAHNSAVNWVEVDVMGLKESRKFVHECAVV